MSRMTEHIGRVLGGRYRLVAPIGRGASAQVFVADDVRLRRQVAVKVLHDALADDQVFLRRFRAEAQAAAVLNHPHVLAVYDWGQDDDGLPWIVTEYLGGGSLRALLDRGHRLSPSQALVVGLQAARGLDYAHRRGFVHRDIKPANLLFDDDARLRIADFGLARALAEAAWTEPQGAVVGTARYASPEQAQGLSLTGRADVYSLALVLVEAVTGEVPFAADTTLGTLMARVGSPLVAPEALGPLGEAVEGAGRPEPDDRLDGRGLAAALARVAPALPRPAPLPLAGAVDVDLSPDRDPTDLLGRARGGDDDLDIPSFVQAGAVAAGTGGAEPSPDPLPAPDATTDPAPAPGPEGPIDPVLDDATVLDDDRTVVDPHWGRGPDRGAVVGGGAAAADDEGGDDLDAADADDADGEHDGSDDGWDPRSPTGRRRRRWPLVAFLALLLGGLGAAVALLVADLAEGTPTHAVPPVTGLGEGAARTTLGQLGFEVDVERLRRDGTQAGDLLGTRPAEGTEVAEGEVVTLLVSDGPTEVDLPAVERGLPADEAEALLEEAGLVPVRAEEVHDEEVPAGAVLAVLGDPPPVVERGTEVELRVSLGPEPRTVPDGLAGAPEADVVAALEALGLVPEVDRAFSDDVGEGLVIAVDPASGAQLDRGATVAVRVSLGPDLVTVPDVSGAATLPEAVAALEAAGVAAGDARGPAAGSPQGTDPGAGERVRRGAEVDILLG